MNRRLWLSTFVLILLAGPAAAQSGQSPNIHIAKQGAWSADCTAEPQTNERWCQVGTTLESREPAYRVEFNYVRDSRMFFAMGAVWLSKVQAQIDGRPAFTMDRCLRGMCLLKGDGATRLLAEMRAGKKLQLHFEGQAQMPAALGVDLAGFEPMYQRAVAAPK